MDNTAQPTSWFGIAAIVLVTLFLQIHAPALANVDNSATSQDNKIIAAVPRHFPPQYQVSKEGHASGFAIDLMDAIAKQANLDVSYAIYDSWQEVNDALRNGKADLIPNMGITQQRKTFLDFTIPLESFNISLFKLAENKSITSVEHLAGMRIGTLTTNIGSQILSQQDNLTVTPFTEPGQTLEALLKGNVDLIAFPDPVIHRIAKEMRVNDRIEPIGSPLTTVSRAIAVRKNAPELLNKLNSALSDFLKTPLYQDLYQKWHRPPKIEYKFAKIAWSIVGTMLFVLLLSAAWMAYRSNRSVQDYLLGIKTDQTERRLRARGMIMTLVMISAVALTAGITLTLLYQVAFEDQRTRLIETVQSQARLMEAMAGHNKDHQDHHIEEWTADTIEHFKQAHAQFNGIGEFTLARRAGDHINFITRQHAWDRYQPAPIPFDAKRAEPMRRALNGQSGSVVAQDYRGVSVLAAYEPVAILDLGVVAKVDIDTIQAPYIEAGLVSGATGVFILIIGGIAFFFLGNPLVQDIVEQERWSKTIFEQAGVGVALINSKTGEFVRINKRYCEIVGFDPAEMTNKTLQEISHPDDIKSDLEHMAKLLAGEISGFTMEKRYLKKDQSIVWVTLTVSPTWHPGQQTDYHIAVVDDITERRQTQQTLNKFFDQPMNLHIIAHQDGTILRVNKGWFGILGYQPHELEGSTFLELVHPDDVDKTLEEMSKLSKGLLTFYFENRYRHKDNSYRLLAWSALSTPEDNTIYAVASDITERTHAVKELNRANRALRALSAASKAIMKAVEEQHFMDTLCQLIVESAGYRLAWIGFAENNSAKDVRPMAQFGFEAGYLDTVKITWADIERGQGPSGIAIRTGKPAIERNIQSSQSFKPWRKQATKRGYNSSIALPLIIDNTVFGVLNIYASETDAFDNQETAFLMDLANDISFGITSLREQMNSRRLASAIEQTGDMVLITNTLGEIQYVNHAFCRISGYDYADIIGKKADIFGPSQNPQKIIEQMYNSLAQGQTWHGNFINRKKNGDLFEVEASISPITNPEGSMQNYVAVYRDISAQKEMEQQLRQSQKMEAIGTLAGGISHDFNNILGIMLGYTELVLDSIPEEDQNHQDLLDVFQAGKRAKELVAQLLTFSRLSETTLKPICVSPVLKECIKFMRASLPSTIEIERYINTPDITVIGDPTRLHQVIMNLCTNAASSMEQDGGTLIITLDNALLNPESAARLKLNPGWYAVITVKDTGPGILPEIKDRLFDPFFTTKDVGKGTGLGLSVVHGIISDIGGAVEVDSEPGKGALFRVYWPVVDEETSIDNTPSTFTTSSQPLHILFIDDEISIARLGTKQLKKLGYQVTSFTDPRKAWRYFQDHRTQFDVVISDQTMPGLTGIELFTRIRQLDSTLSLILCSGRKTPTSEDIIDSLSIRAVLRKPLLLEEIAKILIEIIEEIPG
ncbi:MAG: PAS domain S-box protein [Magnetococcales bacterium]|nr:PAS domain S-box protein [Magnetococcales bacterium]